MKKASISAKAFCIVKMMDLRKEHQRGSEPTLNPESVWMQLNDGVSVQRYVRQSRRFKAKWSVWSNDEWSALAQVMRTETNTYVANVWVTDVEGVDDLIAIAKFLSNNASTLHEDYVDMVEEAKSDDARA